MIKLSNSLEEAKKEALALSLENPGKYITLCACFGIFAEVRSRLHVFSPSDSWFCDVYWLNGKEKPFTKKQRIACQNATPALS